jgi:hypothetical protein
MKTPTIKRLLAALALVLLTGALSSCYIAPGYSYVQGSGYAGDVYYGSAPTAGYYSYYPGYGYYPYGYGYGWGCCYGPTVVGGWWGGGYYGGRYYGRGYYGRGYYGGGHGEWSGHGASHGSSGGGHSGGGGGNHH